jgi:hypothetical protein
VASGFGSGVDDCLGSVAGCGDRTAGHRYEIAIGDHLPALHDRDRIQAPVFHREDRDLGVFTVAFLIEFDSTGRAVVADLG